MSRIEGRPVIRRKEKRGRRDPATLHIVQAAPCMVQGGGEVIVGALARGLTRRGAVVSVVCGSGAASIDTGSSSGPLIMPMGVIRLPLAVARFARLLRRLDPDVVHVHDARSMFVAAAAARLHPVPVLVRTHHGLSHARLAGRGRVERALVGAVDTLAGFVARRWVDRSVAFNEAGRSDAGRRYGLCPGAVITISNGVDTERLKPLARIGASDRLRDELGFGPDDVVVGAVGRLVAGKGHRVLIEAFERVARAEPRAALVLVGDGPLRGRLDAAARASDTAHRIRLLGERRIDAHFYGGLDLMVYPSIAGAYGLVVLEAMACGVPVIASRLEGTDELITDGGNGMLVHAEDPVALADAVLRLVRSASERHRLGEQGRRDVLLRYSETAMVERYEALYRSLLDGAEEPSR